MPTQCDRVSIWQHPDTPVYNPEPATLKITDNYAEIKVASRNWPHGLGSNEVQGWPILCHADGDLEYEGEIVKVEEETHYGGTTRRLKCRPASPPGANVIPPTLQP